MSGWSSITDTWTYNSTDNPTGVINWSGANSKVSVGMRIRFNNGGNTIYGIVMAVTGSTMTFLHEMNEANNNAVNLMANSVITNPFVSAYKVPLGLSLNPNRWSVERIDTNRRQQASPVNGQWYNVGGTNNQITLPIGLWNCSYSVAPAPSGSTSNTDLEVAVTLSTTNNGESTPAHTQSMYIRAILGSSGSATIQPNFYKSFIINRTSKAVYYLNGKQYTGVGTSNDLSFFGNNAATVIRATCAYL